MLQLRCGLFLPFFCLLLAAQPAATVQQWEASARQHLANRDANAALADYEKLAQLVPNSSVYEDEIGFLLAATNRTAQAVSHLKRATELDPKLAQAWYHLGVALWLVQQPDPAVRDLQKAVALAPGHADYRFRLAAAYNDTGHYAQAIPELQRSARQLPTNAAIWEALGVALQQQRRFKEARDA